MLNVKTFAVAAALSLASLSANAACSMTVTRTSEVAKIFSNNGGWTARRFNEICQKVVRANARVVVAAEAVVLQGKSIGWASLILADQNSPITTTSFGSTATSINSEASQTIANERLAVAINLALDDWDIDPAIEALNKERAAFRKAKK